MKTLPRLAIHTEFLSRIAIPRRNCAYFIFSNNRRRQSTVALSSSDKSAEETLVVVGAGAAGIYGAIRAKTIAPHLDVVVIEKGKPLSKVKISGGGRCNVTNGHCVDNAILAGNYPRGNKELRGSFFNIHGPTDTMSWFSDRGIELKTEIDGRVFPVTDSSSTIIDCLISEAKKRGGRTKICMADSFPIVVLQTGKTVSSASTSDDGKFSIKIEKRTVDYVEYVKADYLMIASGSSEQVVHDGYKLATQLGHSIVKPVPSLFTFKIDDFQLVELSGVTFPKVGPMLVTHWGFSGPVILRLSAWGARDLSDSDYKGSLLVDFVPDVRAEDVKSLLIQHKNKLPKQRVINSFPSEFGIVRRFWRYIVEQEDLVEDLLWASISNNLITSIASRLKNCSFRVKGKGQFKDEFVTAGGVPLSEISLNTMQSRIRSRLFFAGEVLNVDGVTGGFNFQNAWSGGFIAGTSIGNLATSLVWKTGKCVSELDANISTF
ncbi:oxidoreductase [Striga asiatica]|uniref:Oxidoreductase n=1 Tax=Striga asiatica TaxID=4170 RepID=A0A5A7PW43_STRAF|nr:oxidoreductase [Striga asiatica]